MVRIEVIIMNYLYLRIIMGMEMRGGRILSCAGTHREKKLDGRKRKEGKKIELNIGTEVMKIQ